MRVLITNSLVLAAISLAPSVSAAPYAAIPSVDSHPNLTALAQTPGTSSVPNVPRDEVVHVDSFRDASSFFAPIAELFDAMGMDTVSDTIPPTEEQMVTLDKLHDALEDAVLRANLPISLPVPGSPGDILPVDPPAIGDAIPDVPKPAVLPLNHPRSLEGRSLQSVVDDIDHVSLLSWVFNPVTSVISSIGALGSENPSKDVQEVLSTLRAVVAGAVQKVKDKSNIVHIEHSREEHERWDHHDYHHEPHMNDHPSHDEHNPEEHERRDHREQHMDDHPSHGEQKHGGKPWEDDNKPRDAQKDHNKPHDAHEDDRKSPSMHSKDRHAHAPNQGDHCKEPRDGQWNDCMHHDGKDRNEDPSPGHTHRA